MNVLNTAARLSELVYEDWPRVRRELRAMGMEMACPPFDVNDAQGMLVEGPGAAHLVFRGTEAGKIVRRDLFANFGRPRAWAGHGLAHSGYARHFARIREPARNFAERVPTATPLYVEGHSMGGDFATLYASYVGSGGPDDHRLAGLITFGTPRALNREALASISCPVWRVTNRYDLAPRLPLIPWLSHPGPRVRVNSGGWPGPVSRHGAGKYVRGTA